MSWQTLLISHPAKLSVKNNNILLRRLEFDDTTIAMSEVSSIVIENPQVILTAVFMEHCAKQNIAIIFTDNKYMPVGVFISFYQHSRTTKHALLQKNWTQTFKKRLWQKIVQAKINNQSQVIFKIKKRQNKQLKYIINQVQSGDKTNREAYAATLYWSSLFDDFKRGNKEDIRNLALDYGYSIIRSAIARSISASGFIPAFGIFHKNELNAFNLADDLIEPFRPLIDLNVYEISKNLGTTKLDSQVRIKLVNMLSAKVSFNKERTTVLNAIWQTTFSLLKASENKNTKYLLLPYDV